MSRQRELSLGMAVVDFFKSRKLSSQLCCQQILSRQLSSHFCLQKFVKAIVKSIMRPKKFFKAIFPPFSVSVLWTYLMTPSSRITYFFWKKLHYLQNLLIGPDQMDKNPYCFSVFRHFSVISALARPPNPATEPSVIVIQQNRTTI